MWSLPSSPLHLFSGKPKKYKMNYRDSCDWFLITSWNFDRGYRKVFSISYSLSLFWPINESSCFHLRPDRGKNLRIFYDSPGLSATSHNLHDLTCRRDNASSIIGCFLFDISIKLYYGKRNPNYASITQCLWFFFLPVTINP